MRFGIREFIFVGDALALVYGFFSFAPHYPLTPELYFLCLCSCPLCLSLLCCNASCNESAENLKNVPAFKTRPLYIRQHARINKIKTNRLLKTM